MKWRFYGALLIFVLLISSVVIGQLFLNRTALRLADRADEVCALLSAEQTEEGVAKLKDLTDEFFRKKTALLLFVNDTRIHEIHRALDRAVRMVEENDLSPALEALSDFSSSFRELAETHLPSWNNILFFAGKFKNLL